MQIPQKQKLADKKDRTQTYSNKLMKTFPPTTYISMEMSPSTRNNIPGIFKNTQTDLQGKAISFECIHQAH